MRKIIASLDIGSHTIKLVVGEMVKNKLNILACIDTPARGIKKGYIVNGESAKEALIDVFKKAQDQLGLPIKKVIVSVPSDNLECFLNEGYAIIDTETQKITHQDIIKALKSCVYKKVSPSREIVSVLPVKFLVDDSVASTMPVGMTASELKVKAVIATVPKKNSEQILKTLESMEIEVIDLTIGAIGDYYEYKDNIISDSVGAVINIGSLKTVVSIFNKGIITASETIDMGGDNIDYDIGYVYKVKRKEAMYLKEKIAVCDKYMAEPSESLLIDNKDGEKIKINQFDVSEVVIERLEEILNLAKKQINLLTKKQISYIIVTGGVSEIAEFKSILESVIPNAIIGKPLEIGARDNKYATAVGLIKYYDSRLRLRNRDFSIFSIEEQEELSGIHRKLNFSENSILGKLFGYFFDN